MLALALSSVLTLSTTYAFTPAQQQQTFAQVRTNAQPHVFATATEAAYAAAVQYGRALIDEEIGAKIYVDYSPSGPVYSFGAVMLGQIDPDSGEPEITYPLDQTDGHSAIVGLWHEHRTGDTWRTLLGHEDAVRETGQAVWTSVGTTFFVQYWNGISVMPLWDPAAASLPALCTRCVV